MRRLLTPVLIAFVLASVPIAAQSRKAPKKPPAKSAKQAAKSKGKGSSKAKESPEKDTSLMEIEQMLGKNAVYGGKF